MSNTLVIARDAFGQPLKRVVISRGNGVVYLANPERLEAVARGESIPVGFPQGDVFALNVEVFEDLADEWGRLAKVDPASWGRLSRYYG